MMFDVDAALGCGGGSTADDESEGGREPWPTDITNGVQPRRWDAPMLIRHPRVCTIRAGTVCMILLQPALCV